MISSIGVHIKVRNFDKSVIFYESLGFKKVFEYGPEMSVKEDYRGTTFEHNGCKLEIAEGHRAVKPEVFQEQVKSSKISLMIQADSIHEILEKCHQHKIAIAVGPRHYYWGTLELVIKDPDGVVLVFICPYSKEEAQKVAASERFGKLPRS